MTEFSYQLYSSRKFPPLIDTMRMLKAIGYTQVEAYAGLFDDVGLLKDGLQETGLTMPSSHFGLDMLESDPERVMEIASTLGVSTIYCPHITPDLRPEDAKGWGEFGERLEIAGAPFRNAGLKFGWHNHDFEFVPLADGSRPMEHILQAAPSLAWEADIAWIVRGGGDPFDWIERHGNRIDAVHIKDIAPSGENADEDGWADVGHGTLDWKKLMEVLATTAVRIFIVEHDNPSDHQRFAKRSLQSLQQYQEKS